MVPLIAPFVLNNLRWLLPLVGVIVLFLSAWWYISSVKQEAYDKGVLSERTRYEQIIAAEDAKNREFESLINKSIADYGQRAVREAAKRIEKETIHTRTIETIVKDNPIYINCKADKEVIDSRNAIRSLGPAK
jgi:hypothetical protein